MIETDDFLADLERYLHEAAERRDEGAPARRPLPGRGLAAVALALAGVALVIALGRGALSSPADDVAATPPSVTPWRTPTPPSPQVEAQGKRIASRAIADVGYSRTCRTAPDAVPAVVDTPLSPAIRNLLPGLAGPGFDPARLRLEPMTARGVLRSGARQLSLGSGLTLTVYVLDGLPVGGLKDPAGCLGARLAVAASLAAGKPAAVQRSAESHLRAVRDTAPDLQTLMLQLGRTGQQGWSGAGLPVWSAHALEPRLALSGSAGKGRSEYLAIAERRAAHVVVHAPKPFTVPVKQGFYGLVLPRGTGRVMLEETAADGTVVATRWVR